MGIGFDLGGLLVYDLEARMVGLLRIELSRDADSEAGKCDALGLSENGTGCFPCDFELLLGSLVLERRLPARLLPRVGGLEGEIVFPEASWKVCCEFVR